MNIQPLGDRVVIKPSKLEKITAGGLIIPDVVLSKEKPQDGIIVAISNSDSMTVKNGDKVLYGKFSGTEIEIDKEKYLILRESDIIAILD